MAEKLSPALLVDQIHSPYNTMHYSMGVFRCMSAGDYRALRWDLG